MRLEGSVTIKATRDKVWQFLTDPHQVSSCAPGVEKVEVLVPPTRFRATASVGFGSVKARFTGEGEFAEMEAPNRALIKGHGDAPGSAVDVTSEMILTDNGDGTTTMAWTAEVMVMGTLASLASRMMGTVAQKLTGEFFNCAKRKIEA